MAEGVKRKISVILSTDVVGYSKLMDADEEATLRALASYADLMSELIQRHRGWVADAAGDWVLVEFSSNWNAERLS